MTNKTADGRRLHRGDTVDLLGSLGTVLRVASDESWVDVGWWRSDGSSGWSKRQRMPKILSRNSTHHRGNWTWPARPNEHHQGD